jgi:hypothetical protein
MTEHPLLRPGDHVCWAVDGSGEHDQLVARWAREGLDRDERLLFAAPSRAR